MPTGHPVVDFQDGLIQSLCRTKGIIKLLMADADHSQKGTSLTSDELYDTLDAALGYVCRSLELVYDMPSQGE